MNGVYVDKNENSDPHLKRCRKLLKNMKKRARNYRNKSVNDKRHVLCDLAEASGHVSVLVADRLIEKFSVHFEPLREALSEPSSKDIPEVPANTTEDVRQLSLPLPEAPGPDRP